MQLLADYERQCPGEIYKISDAVCQHASEAPLSQVPRLPMESAYARSRRGIAATGFELDYELRVR